MLLIMSIVWLFCKMFFINCGALSVKYKNRTGEFRYNEENERIFSLCAVSSFR